MSASIPPWLLDDSFASITLIGIALVFPTEISGSLGQLKVEGFDASLRMVI